jgi:hypothetical protein
VFAIVPRTVPITKTCDNSSQSYATYSVDPNRDRLAVVDQAGVEAVTSSLAFFCLQGRLQIIFRQ